MTYKVYNKEMVGLTPEEEERRKAEVEKERWRKRSARINENQKRAKEIIAARHTAESVSA